MNCHEKRRLQRLGKLPMPNRFLAKSDRRPSKTRHPRGAPPLPGTIYNVWCGRRLLGIVNTATYVGAEGAAGRRWPRLTLKVIEARLDPYRLKNVVRGWMLARPGVIQ